MFDKIKTIQRTNPAEHKKIYAEITLVVVVGLIILGIFNKSLPVGVPVLVYGILALIFFWTHAASILGFKDASKMFISGWLIGYVIEESSIHLNVGGGYTFMKMGPKLDVVPFAIPISWVCMIYVSWLLVNLILDGAPTPRNNGHLRIFARAIAADLIMTTLDLEGDPMSVAQDLWIWHHGGPFFGVPIENYSIIWFAVGTLTIILHGYQQRKNIDVTIDHASRSIKIWTIIPIVMFALIWIGMTQINFGKVFGIIQFFSMGGPAILGLVKWFDWYKAVK